MLLSDAYEDFVSMRVAIDAFIETAILDEMFLVNLVTALSRNPKLMDLSPVIYGHVTFVLALHRFLQ